MAVQAKPTVQLVANVQGIIEVESDEGRGDMAGESFDDDADLLHLGLDVVGSAETEVRIVRQDLRGYPSLQNAKGYR